MDSVHEFHLHLYGPHQGPIEASFEQAEARLVQLPNLHFEPDGSFVWTLDGGRQQVFGMLYDANNQIQYCELRGCCGSIAWKNLCFAIIGSCGIDHFVLKLPDALVQDLQIFQQSAWPEKR